MDNYEKNNNQTEKTLSSRSEAKTFKECEKKHCLSEEELNQNLKNYIDCNKDGMVYNENMKNDNY